MRRRHAEYFVTLAERAEPEPRLARYDYWCGVFELEMDNLRAVLEWALRGGDIVLGVRLAGALSLFWYGKGYHVEGIQWTQQLLGRLDEAPASYHPQFLISAAHMAWMHDLDAAKRILHKALALSRELEDAVHTAWALAFLGYTMIREPDAAMPLAEEGLALFRELKHLPGIAQTLNIIGEITRTNGDDDRAGRVYEESLAICRQTGEIRRICYMCNNLAYIAQHAGDHARAIDLGRQALRLARERRDQNDIATALNVLVGSISMTGQPQRAARLLGAVDATFERLGAFHQPSDQPEVDRIVATVRAQFDDATFQAVYGEGRSMTLEEAVAYALEDPSPGSS
jgi:tetratricopeptide (TPR) repeat protein